MRGAGGTTGGSGRFFIGLIMLCGGLYLLFNSINVYSSYGFSARLYSVGGYRVTSGMIMIPFMFGIGLVFYNARNYLGWLLACGSLVALVFGVISSIQFTFQSMSAFDLIVILVLSVGGLGLFLSSLKSV
jgi:hypothetical protein